MRRKDREITEIDDIFTVVSKCTIARLAMIDDGRPYMVALNFGYDRAGDDLILYFHSAMEGRKMDILKKAPDVYFEMDTASEIIRGTEESPCSFSWRFDSVMGSGKVAFITDNDEKSYVLNRIIQHLDKADTSYVFPPNRLERTCVYKVVSTDITGKRRE